MDERRGFRDRQEAGGRLAARLARFAAAQPIVLALPRGGVPVAAEIARALAAPLDVLVVRKLGAPFQPELGVGAVTEGGGRYVDWGMCAVLGLGRAEVDAISARERVEVERRVRRYRGGRPLMPVAGRTVILVDDGVATGGTARAAIRALRELGAARVVFAVPVAALEAAEMLRREADEVVAVEVARDLVAIGAWYRDFQQVDDAEVMALLAGSTEEDDRPLGIDVGDATLEGDLSLPAGAEGVVLFAHGSGSSRRSRRNRYVAAVLQAAGVGTLLMDLLTDDEAGADELTAELRFDIPLLSRRVVGAVDWLTQAPATRGLGIGCFGSSTGAAAALVAAAQRPAVAAVVSRGGRPDLAGRALAHVRAPTLFIVGGADDEVLALNRAALARLPCETELAVVPGATHLFEEPGALARVGALAAAWFARHLAARHEPAIV